MTETLKHVIVKGTYSDSRVYQGTISPHGGILREGLVLPPQDAIYSHRIVTGPDGMDDTGVWHVGPAERKRRPDAPRR